MVVADRARSSAALLSVLAVAACATPIELPSSFVELGDSGDGYRAMTSDDARVWVRTMTDPSPGGVDFWAQSVKRDFVEQRGYDFVRASDVENAAGQSGRCLEFIANHHGRRVDYMIAIWSRDRSWPWSGKEIRLVEFAAASEAYERLRASVRSAMSTVNW